MGEEVVSGGCGMGYGLACGIDCTGIVGAAGNEATGCIMAGAGAMAGDPIAAAKEGCCT
jgi:hypothetical protein